MSLETHYRIPSFHAVADSNLQNGRQIRNAFQTAVALADYDAFKIKQEYGADRPPHLTKDHFEKVAKASKEFDSYLRTTWGGHSEHELARRLQERADHRHDPARTAIDSPSTMLHTPARLDGARRSSGPSSALDENEEFPEDDGAGFADSDDEHAEIPDDLDDDDDDFTKDSFRSPRQQESRRPPVASARNGRLGLREDRFFT